MIVSFEKKGDSKMKRKISIVLTALVVLFICVCAIGCKNDTVPHYVVYSGKNTVSTIKDYFPDFDLDDGYWWATAFDDKNFDIIVTRGNLKTESLTEVEIENRIRDLGVGAAKFEKVKKIFFDPKYHCVLFHRTGNNVEIFAK